MMRVHRDVEQTSTGLDCGKLDQIVLAERCIYTHTLITEVNRKINLLSWASMGYHKVASLVSNGSWSIKLIKYHEFKVFSRKKLNKLMILVVLLCPLYSIVCAIFKKQKNNQNGLCEHLLAHAYAIHIFLLEHKLKQC